MKRRWEKHIPEGNPVSVQIPEIGLNELFQQSVEKYKDNVAVTFVDQTMTYNEVNEKIEKAAASLKKMGIKKGDRIALMLPNCPQYVFSYYGALHLGAIIIQVNPMYKESELLHVLNDAQAKAIVVFEPLAPLVAQVKDKTSLEHVITVSFNQPSDFDSLLNHQLERVPLETINPKENVAVLQYTGGTTRRSKGAMLTHYNLVANIIQSAATAKVQTKLGKERVLTISPLFHVYGMTSGMNLTFHNGGNLVLVPKFDIENVVEIIQKVKPTSFPGVPTMFIGLLNYARKHNIDLSCLEVCTSGSAPLSADVLTNFKGITGAPIAEGYGLSEASPVTHRNPIRGLQKPGSIGIPIPNTDSKIVDLATGEQNLGVGEVGELVVKGPQVMKGYWNMPEETANTIRNGWLYTGDLAKMDEDGFFYIVGRKKELIIASGFNVYPIEVEDVIYQHPKVLEAAVIGVPDPYRGETIKAIVSLKEGESLTEEELITFCKSKLANFKVPTSIEFLDELPKTAVGKILKRKLKELYTAQ